jgi:23S rRNA pseudouridine2605 synthase
MSEKPKKSGPAGRKPSKHANRKTKPDGTKEPRMRKRAGSDFEPERPFRRNSDERTRAPKMGDNEDKRSGNRFTRSDGTPRDTRSPFNKSGDRPQRRSSSDSDDRNTRGPRKDFDFKSRTSRGDRPERTSDRPSRSSRPSFNRDEDRPRRRSASESEGSTDRGPKKEFDFKKGISRGEGRPERSSDRPSRSTRPSFNRDEDRPRRRSASDSEGSSDRAPRKEFDFKKGVSRDARPERSSDRPGRSDRPAYNRDDARPPRRSSSDSESGSDRAPRKSVEFKKSTSRDARPEGGADRPSRSARPSFNRDDERPKRRPFDSDGSSDRGPKKDFEFKKRTTGSRDDRDSRPFNRESRNDDREPRPSFGRDRNEDSPRSGAGFGLRSSRGRQGSGGEQSSRGKSREEDSHKGFTRRNSTKEDVPAFKITRAKGKEREVVWGSENTEKDSGTVRKSYRDEKVIRLNRYIANAGICSRREADTLIEAGTVTINGVIVTEMGAKVGPDDVVLYGGQRLSREKLVYVLLNKPKDYVTTMRDPQGRKTVDQLVKGACRERIVPVGRLDRETSGLLLMTNDGDMAKKLTHPKHGVLKLYHVHTDKKVTTDHLHQLLEGITLEDGPAKADKAAYVGDTQREVGLEIHMGRNRIVRRMFESLGYKVVKLDRVIFAGLTKKDLPRGRWRYLTDMEVNKLKMVK